MRMASATSRATLALLVLVGCESVGASSVAGSVTALAEKCDWLQQQQQQCKSTGQCDWLETQRWYPKVREQCEKFIRADGTINGLTGACHWLEGIGKANHAMLSKQAWFPELAATCAQLKAGHRQQSQDAYADDTAEAKHFHSFWNGIPLSTKCKLLTTPGVGWIPEKKIRVQEHAWLQQLERTCMDAALGDQHGKHVDEKAELARTDPWGKWGAIAGELADKVGPVAGKLLTVAADHTRNGDARTKPGWDPRLAGEGDKGRTPPSTMWHDPEAMDEADTVALAKKCNWLRTVVGERRAWVEQQMWFPMLAKRCERINKLELAEGVKNAPILV